MAPALSKGGGFIGEICPPINCTGRYLAYSQADCPVVHMSTSMWLTQTGIMVTLQELHTLRLRLSDKQVMWEAF